MKVAINSSGAVGEITDKNAFSLLRDILADVKDGLINQDSTVYTTGKIRDILSYAKDNSIMSETTRAKKIEELLNAIIENKLNTHLDVIFAESILYQVALGQDILNVLSKPQVKRLPINVGGAVDEAYLNRSGTNYEEEE